MKPFNIGKVSYLGPRVKITRVQKGLTEQELAKRVGFASAKQVVAIEKSRRSLKSEELEKLAKALGKPWWYFTDPATLVCEEKYRYLVDRNTSKR